MKSQQYSSRKLVKLTVMRSSQKLSQKHKLQFDTPHKPPPPKYKKTSPLTSLAIFSGSLERFSSSFQVWKNFVAMRTVSFVMQVMKPLRGYVFVFFYFLLTMNMSRRRARDGWK